MHTPVVLFSYALAWKMQFSFGQNVESKTTLADTENSMTDLGFPEAATAAEPTAAASGNPTLLRLGSGAAFLTTAHAAQANVKSTVPYADFIFHPSYNYIWDTTNSEPNSTQHDKFLVHPLACCEGV